MRRTVLKSLTALVIAAGIAACASAGSTTDTAAIGKAIDALDANANRWFNTGAVDSIVTGYYTTDAIVIDPNAPAVKGSDAIRKDLAGEFAIGTLKLHFQRSTLVAADSLASDYGTYTLEIRDKKDSTKVLMSDRGSYVTTFVNRGGEWRAIYDITASELPAAPAAPMKAEPKKK